MGDKHSRSTPAQPRRPESSSELRAQIDALAEQVRRLGGAGSPGAPVPAATADPEPEPEPAARPGELTVDVIAIAERAADEIRESARREAARILARPERGPAPAAMALLAVLRRERQALAVLAAETERLEQSAEILRGQVRALEVELAQIHDILGLPPGSPVWSLPDGPSGPGA